MRWPLLLLVLSAALAHSGCVDRPPEAPSSHPQDAPERAVAAAGESPEAAPGPEGAEPLDWSYLDAHGVLELDWLQMLPADELEMLSRPLAVRHVGNQRMAQYGSDRVVPAVLGFPVRLPGYVVPLETDAQGRVTELFLVPYYGACIHMPPPPPNQMVYVRLATPTPVEDIYEPYWIEGELTAEPARNEIAGTAYTMNGARLQRYED